MIDENKVHAFNRGDCHCRLRANRSPLKTSLSFELGTNAVLHLQRELPSGGYYVFLLKFPGIDRSKFEKDKWPLQLGANFSLLVKTNGEIILTTNISTLRFDYINEKRKELVYYVAGLSLPQGVKVGCAFEDLGSGPVRPAEFIFVRAMAK